MTPNAPFTFEQYAQNSKNYLEKLVDSSGQPYFNVFWSEPAEAAHDWPDFGDVMSRQWQGAIMLRRMTGLEASTEKIWQRKVLELIDPTDGLLHRPATSYSQPVADYGDAALTLYALATAAIESGDPLLRTRSVQMAEGLLKRLRGGDYPADGFAIKSLMVTARYLHCEAALEAARLIIERVIIKGTLFTPDNTFGAWGHMHGNLRTMVGAADYALTTGDPTLYSRMDALFRYVKASGTRFGFLPEAIGRKGDIVSCETCALMDFAGMGVTLANHGHPEYWGDMERLARNQYAESQIRQADWLRGDDSKPDTEQFTWRDITGRVEGAWAGWTSPNHILAALETLGAHWGGQELHHKWRALQNCCGGSGVHGLYTLWKNAARFEQGVLSVHMHLDKKLPQAEIRCQQPYQGRLTVRFDQGCELRVRIPEFTQAKDMRVKVNGKVIEQQTSARGNYLELGSFPAGEQVEIQYPLPVYSEEISIGNPGFRQWHYRVTWKGDTVVGMEATGQPAPTAYSDFDKKEMRVFYGEDGPGPLYQRADFLKETEPTEPPLYLDEGALDFWKVR